MNNILVNGNISTKVKIEIGGQNNDKKKLWQTKRITLVALVVTIVVLLILAGITITYVMGDNSIFNKASNAKLNTELAKIEEQASLIYADKLLEKVQTNFNNKPTMQEIVGELRDKGYTIEQIEVSANTVTGISLDKESMSLGKTKSNTIQVTLEGNNDPYDYYVKVEGKYYQMHFNGGVVTIDRTESDISGSGDTTTQTITVSSSDENIATATIDNTTNVITVTAKNTAGTVTITVTYGSYTKVCNVRVCDAATGISLNAKFGVVTGGESWTKDLNLIATVTPESADQTIIWKSSDESTAIVDRSGVVKAKTGGKGGDIKIIATTADGTNLSAECEVRVEMFSKISSSNMVYTDNTSQETYKTVTIPKDYAVGTSDNVNKIDEGLVIQDNTGNQFVWVPVDDTAFIRMIDTTNHRGNLYNFTTSGAELIPYSASDSKEPDIVTKYDNTSSYYAEAGITGITNANEFKELLQNEFNGMENSVKKYKGFFIGRYETGNVKADNVSVPIVKRGEFGSNGATWYYQYANGKKVAKNTSVTSCMIWGCQWDRTLEWIVQRNEGEYSLIIDSSDWGNYSGTSFEYMDVDGTTKLKVGDKAVPTGSTERNKKNNIYDMAGNGWDWTMEAKNDASRVHRRRKF